jgi:tRNA-splicing ligase RtcB (3'-phosphate/5'-hydroxy nucleic acid ligase)
MNIHLEQIDPYRWLIPRTGNMRVPGIVFSSKDLIGTLAEDPCLIQVANVAMLPGILEASLAMPDIHWGYGFPIGGVAAFDSDEGIVSPGGVGYDINCGCRLLATDFTVSDVAGAVQDMINALFAGIAAGVGSKGSIRLSKAELAAVAVEGAAWAVKKGLGSPEDLEYTEDHGTMPGADPSLLSDRAVKRGLDQLGSLGSGNHFIEVQAVDALYDLDAAQAFGLWEGQVTILIHSGSRGFGHQICDDFLKEMTSRAGRSGLGFDLPDRQLACAPVKSDQGRRYLSAMACAANYAWANRQVLMHRTREVLAATLGVQNRPGSFKLIYDISHNIAKKETHKVNGRNRVSYVHRKGATRSLPPGHPYLPSRYSGAGQPVLIPGDMGTESYVMAGAQRAMDLSFGSCCHGAGRILSRTQAVKRARGRSIRSELKLSGIVARSHGKRTLEEEMPEAYKNISQVVEIVHETGLARKVARLRPLGVIKG